MIHWVLKGFKIAVVMPAYKSKNEIIEVLKSLPTYIDKIYVIDDACPEFTGKTVEVFVKKQNSIKSEILISKKIDVIFNQSNLGVGGASSIGFVAAKRDKFDIIVKVDSDGQMPIHNLKKLLSPIIRGETAYSKGTRMHVLSDLDEMPKLRIFGNIALTFITRFSSGYYSMSDPTNGFIAINRQTLELIPISQLSTDWLFETDMLYQLRLLDCRIAEVPSSSIYTKKSNLNELKVIPKFIYGNLKNLVGRLTLQYFLRASNLGSAILVFIVLVSSMNLIGNLLRLFHFELHPLLIHLAGYKSCAYIFLLGFIFFCIDQFKSRNLSIVNRNVEI